MTGVVNYRHMEHRDYRRIVFDVRPDTVFGVKSVKSSFSRMANAGVGTDGSDIKVELEIQLALQATNYRHRSFGIAQYMSQKAGLSTIKDNGCESLKAHFEITLPKRGEGLALFRSFFDALAAAGAPEHIVLWNADVMSSPEIPMSFPKDDRKDVLNMMRGQIAVARALQLN